MGGFDRGLADHDLLETAFECRILLDVLAVFVERGRADAVQLAARPAPGLSMLPASIAPSALAGPHHRVDLVDEDDGLALVGPPLPSARS